MKYTTRLTTDELRTLLENNNPNRYDEIRIVFKIQADEEAPKIIYMTNLNHPIFEVDLFTDNFGKQLRQWKDVKQEYYFMNVRLTEDETINYDNIKSIRCTYYNNQHETNYTGNKLQARNKDELKTFFYDNKDELKKANFGGSYIFGIGDKKLRIDYNYYTWNKVYKIYTQQETDYTVNKVLNFIQ